MTVFWSVGEKLEMLIKTCSQNLNVKLSALIKGLNLFYTTDQKGARQGCILSPMLFNLYLNEIP